MESDGIRLPKKIHKKWKIATQESSPNRVWVADKPVG